MFHSLKSVSLDISKMEILASCVLETLSSHQREIQRAVKLDVMECQPYQVMITQLVVSHQFENTEGYVSCRLFLYAVNFLINLCVISLQNDI